MIAFVPNHFIYGKISCERQKGNQDALGRYLAPNHPNFGDFQGWQKIRKTYKTKFQKIVCFGWKANEKRVKENQSDEEEN